MQNKDYSTFEQRILDECSEIGHMLIHKNREYGDSHKNQIEKYGLISLLIRLNDKISRLESIYEKEEQEIVFESAMDTIQDIAGYCILTNTIRRFKDE